MAFAVAYLALTYVIPILNLLVETLNDGVSYSAVFSSSVNLRVLWKTFAFAGEVTLMTLALSYPIAYLARISGARTRRVVLFMSTVPLWTSFLVRTFAWQIILGRRGVINGTLQSLGLTDNPLRLGHTTFGALVGSVYIVLPVMVLVLYAAMRDVDLNTVMAARTLGGRPAQASLRVFVPLSLPGVVAGVLLVFILSLGFFITPVLLGGPSDQTFSLLVYQRIDILGDFKGAAALSVMLLVPALLFLVLFGIVIGFDQFMGGHLRRRPIRWSSGLMGRTATRVLHFIGPVLRPLEARVLWWILTILVLFVLVLPYVVIIPISFSSATYLQFPPPSLSTRWFQEVLGSRDWQSAGSTSLVVALGATVGATLVGLLVALGLREVPRRIGQAAIPLFMAPMMVPLMIYSVAAFFWGNKFNLFDTRLGLALAHSALGIPFVAVVASTALSGMNRFVEPAARSLGAGRWAVLRRVTLPLIVPALLVAAVMAFQTSFDEVVVSLFLTAVRNRTIPKLMWASSTLEANAALTSAGVLILATIAVVALLAFAARRLFAPGHGLRR